MGAQTTGFDPVQTPPSQVSVCVHRLPSLLHPVPSGTLGLVQEPVSGSHVPTSWQSSSAVQTTGFDPTQLPAWQVSVCVQRLPSTQVVPLGLAGSEQTPVPVSQTPAL